MTTHTESETMSVAELAKKLNISLGPAYELAKEDRLPIPVIKVGNKYRFSRRAYDDLMSRQHDGKE